MAAATPEFRASAAPTGESDCVAATLKGRAQDIKQRAEFAEARCQELELELKEQDRVQQQYLTRIEELELRCSELEEQVRADDGSVWLADGDGGVGSNGVACAEEDAAATRVQASIRGRQARAQAAADGAAATKVQASIRGRQARTHAAADGAAATRVQANIRGRQARTHAAANGAAATKVQANIRGRQARAQAAADGAAATKVQASIRGRQARTRVRSGWTPPAGHLHDENFGGENTSALFQGWMRSRVDGARALADGEASANARPPAEESAALFGEWMKALVQNASKRAESARTDRTAPAQPRKEFHPSAYL